jgi:hypothetical protein
VVRPASGWQSQAYGRLVRIAIVSPGGRSLPLSGSDDMRTTLGFDLRFMAWALVKTGLGNYKGSASDGKPNRRGR